MRGNLFILPRPDSMSAKTSPQRRAAFFRALFETGNQTLAAERARVSRSWVQLHRSTDPGFDEAVRDAIAEAKVALSQRSASSAEHDGSSKPPRKWAWQNGEELVVRGSRGRRVQVARARLHQWTPRVEGRFLACLEQVCNLRLALREVGFTAASLHEHRRRWPAFDAACEVALARGFERLDTGLAHAACRLFSPDAYPLPEAPVVGPMNASAAISLMRLHEKRRAGRGRRIRLPGR